MKDLPDRRRDEADLKLGLINISSPIARALIGKGRGRRGRSPGAGWHRRYEIVAVHLPSDGMHGAPGCFLLRPCGAAFCCTVARVFRGPSFRPSGAPHGRKPVATGCSVSTWG